MLNHVFTTPVLRDSAGLSPELRAEIREHLLAQRAAAPGEAKSNRGGWHSGGNLFATDQRQFPEMRDAITKALFAYIAEIFGYRGEIQLALTGWSVINRAGDYNVPHNHAANLLSGALYLCVPAGMTGGAIVFQDPRLNLNAHETEGMRRLKVKPPWMSPTINVQPVEDEILIFPSWLNHWVEPFQCDEPEALRIVISFNSTVP
ncbi:MAG: TIGR02466 family protein [Chthoniobacteraceae bacterium]